MPAKYKTYENLEGVALIGDPHLGKKFHRGVPLNRLGEREVHHKIIFQETLMKACSENHTVVVMGDLFDKFSVGDDVILHAYHAFISALIKTNVVSLVLLRGNHDVSRNKDKVSSFDLLKEMLKPQAPRMLVVDQPEVVGKHLYLPYDAFSNNEETLKEKFPGYVKEGYYDGIFGHWDLQSFGGDDFNLVPVDFLAPMLSSVGAIYSGHEHRPVAHSVSNWNNTNLGRAVKVFSTGSLLPFSHGEDPDQEIYVSIRLKDFEEQPEKYRNKCVRLLLKPGESLPENPDVLQVSVKYVDEEGKEQKEATLDENFSFRNVFFETFEEAGLDKEISNQWWEKYQERTKDD